MSRKLMQLEKALVIECLCGKSLYELERSFIIRSVCYVWQDGDQGHTHTSRTDSRKIGIGHTTDDLRQAYPKITMADIQACLWFAADNTKHEKTLAVA